MDLSSRFLKYQHFRSEGIQILVSTVFNSFSYTAYICLTLMVTLMALFMLPLHSQPCLETPPFWDPSEAVSCRGRKSRSHTVNSPGTAHAQGGEDISVSLYQRENITQLFQCVVTERSGWFNPPTLVFTQCTGNLWCCSMRWNSSTRCSSAPFQTGRRTLNKQWPSSLINIDILPCKAKTNSLKQNFCYGPKDWLMGQTISSESHQLEEKKRLKCVIVRWRTQHDPKKAAWSLNTVIVSCVSDMKSIWKSSDLFLLHSVEELSKARRRGEKNMSGYRLELLFSPEGHIKRSFDPKLKLNKGPNTQWLKKQLFWGF